jgi:hypothetical protein
VRYKRGSIALSDTADLPLLLFIRNARACTQSQITAFACMEGLSKNRRVLQWRLARLEQFAFISRSNYLRLSTQEVISITPVGLEYLESRGLTLLSMPSDTKRIVHQTQIFHCVELVAIRLALASKGILKSWKWELEIVSENLVSHERMTKDFDAVVEANVGNTTRRFAIEFERTLKGSSRYGELRRIFDAERSVETILYLTPSADILYVLAMELRGVHKKIGFALSNTFQTHLLDSDVLMNNSQGELISLREFLDS